MNDWAKEFQREGLSISEACHIAGVGRTKLYEFLSSGALTARKVGKKTLILRQDLMCVLLNLTEGRMIDVRPRSGEARHRADAAVRRALSGVGFNAKTISKPLAASLR